MDIQDRADEERSGWVVTDAQMADAARHENLSLPDLRQIDGFGDARASRYGSRSIEINKNEKEKEL